MPRYNSPYPDIPEAWIEVPTKWVGRHAARYEEANAKAKARNWPQNYQNFACALALLDDWYIPGLNGNPEKWDFADFDLRIMAWVVRVVLDAYFACFQVPKNGLRPLRNGQVTALKDNPPGTLENTPTT